MLSGHAECAISCYDALASIYSFTKQDTVSAKRNVAKYSNQDPSYSSTREAKFIQALIEAVEAGDQEAFTGAVVEFDQVTKLDNWKTGMLLKIKRALQDGDTDVGIM